MLAAIARSRWIIIGVPRNRFNFEGRVASRSMARGRPGAFAHPACSRGGREMAATSGIQFENVIQSSKIKLLKNSVSPHRFTFETMVGGLALFDSNKDGLLDIFTTERPSHPWKS